MMQNNLQRRSLVIPLAIMGGLVLSSFLPLIQIMLMTLNGAIMYPVFSKIDNDETAVRYVFILDSLMSLIGLVLFYISIKDLWEILSAIFTVLFLLPLMVFSFGFIETDLYFVQDLIAGFSVGLILFIVALLKKRFAGANG